MAPLFGTANRQNRPSSEGFGRKIRKRDVAAYALLPQILPRFGDLFFTGFHLFAFFMAQVYRGVRLLPADHPTLNPSNIGQFGVRDVIGAATRHLVWKRENIDQILVYMAILMGLLLVVLQALTFLMAVAVPQASAASGFTSMFSAAYPEQDIAFILLDRVFGVPGIFNSCVSMGTICAGVEPTTMDFDYSNPAYTPDVFPWAFHEGLHALFSFYSVGLLLVAVFILIYYVIVIVAETAQTGTPFGKRFNTVWAPIRLVVAFGLLIPVANGLNSAQYITLYAAKWGSNFATNGWREFNRAMGDSAAGMAQGLNLVVKPKEPDPQPLLQFMTLAHECKIFAETTTANPGIPAAEKLDGCTEDKREIEAYIVKPGYDTNGSAKFLRDTNYGGARDFAENNDIIIRFGTKSCRKNYAMAGNIEPTCGEISLPVNSLTNPGALAVQSGYYDLIKHLWGGYGSGATITTYNRTPDVEKRDPQVKACVPSFYNTVLNSGTGDMKIREYALSYFQNGVTDEKTGQCNKNEAAKYNTDYENLKLPPGNWMRDATRNYSVGSEEPSPETASVTTRAAPYSAYEGAAGSQDVIIRNILRDGVIEMSDAIASGDYNVTVSEDNLQRGWATAGIWYNKIAEMNGALIGAAWDLPATTRYPEIMMRVLATKKQTDQQVSTNTMFDPAVSNGTQALDSAQSSYASAMSNITKQWNQSRAVSPTGNVLADFVNVLFGIQGLFDLRYEQNSRAHPLAMLVGIGKGLIEASIRNMGLGLGSGLFSILPSLFGITPAAELATAISSFFIMIATTTLTAGFVLYYVIPFLPFLYFFFAVGNWLKGVFEAMVGVPLWALAHLRIDGNGLPGEAAINGYFMLFEIFLRPIIILFGFLASITVFAAMASVLHEVFEVAVNNLTGSASASGASQAVDKFFYTVMYAVIMYILALSSFKLIDLVPNQIMRWMGTSVSTFSDLQQNAAESLTQYTAIAGSQITQGLAGGLQQGMGGIQKAAGSLGQAARNLK